MRFTIAVLCSIAFLSCSGKSGVKAPADFFPRVSDAGRGVDPGLLQRRSAVFFNDRVHLLRITIDPELFRRKVLTGSGRYSAADLDFDGQVIKNIGIRIRGSKWSRRIKKKQFKLHFAPRKLLVGKSGLEKRFAANRGRRFNGLRKLNLRCNGDNDPALITDKLTSEVFLSAGAIYPRTGMTRVWINGAYQGLYLLTEHPDATMLRIRLGNSLGNQFKGRWRGGDAMNLYPDRFNRSRYKPVRRLNRWNWHDLANFLTRLQKAESLKSFGQLVDIKSFTAYWAAAVLAGHWDSLIGNKQNDHIFHNAANGKWYIIGWDGDNSFGIGERNRWTPFAVSTTAPLEDAFGSRNKTLLFRQAHRIPALVALYKQKVKAVLASGFAEDALLKRIDFLAGKLRPYLKDEPPTSVLTAAAFDGAVAATKGFVRARHAYLRQVLGGAR